MDTTTTTTAADITTITVASGKLKKSSTRSLDELVKSKTRRTLLLVDCSDSMNEHVGREGVTKISRLREVVATLRKAQGVPVAAFGHCGYEVTVVDAVPPARGSTPLHIAIEFATAQGANHLIVVTDGEPDSEPAAFEAARLFGGPIDVAFVGNPNGRGAAFARELCHKTGGECDLTGLGQPKELTARLAGLLGDGSDVL